MEFFTSAQDFFVSNNQSKKFELIQKSYVPEPIVSHAKALPAKRSEMYAVVIFLYTIWETHGVMYFSLN